MVSLYIGPDMSPFDEPHFRSQRNKQVEKKDHLFLPATKLQREDKDDVFDIVLTNFMHPIVIC
jgi:hypothetical protein